MVDVNFESLPSRARTGWWLFILLLALVAGFIAYSFVGMLVLGVFGYYATRPIYRKLSVITDSDGIIAALTLLVVFLPIFTVALYAGFKIVTWVQQLFGTTSDSTLLVKYLGALSNEQRQAVVSAIQNPNQFVTKPQQTLQTVFDAGLMVTSGVIGAIMLIALAVTLSYFLLKNDDQLSAGIRQLFGGSETTAYAYAVAVDEDLESVFFGNLLFIVSMSIIASVAYWGTNLVAPGSLRIPMVFVLAFLTGVASLIPIVVGKIVYLPVVGYLAIQAMNSNGDHFAFVGGVLVVYFLLLDTLPQTFLQPYITGRQLDMVMMMFAYLLGPILFGWYGFFLLPILFILILEAIRIVLPELLHGEALTPTVSMGESVGTNPRSTTEQLPPDNGEATGDSADTDVE
ncbi:Predicted PurR-regulated permease PerM [Haladaptatus litoreus]|uniref:Predicted PurR-regulated permease PerM n=1 Tax=Haladaptatus litoreus TaxID=553468 RepID=A0A1N7CS34_9EURY|nr:AI-2E family transporter [Haladaptatus litoreus]SIR66307.1 Predicted PurR-regulated permease PerM [Haladaptatus litoreus]